LVGNLTASPKTPDAIVAKLNEAVNTAMKDPELLDRFHKLNLRPGGGTLAATSACIKSETQNWGDVIREAGIKPH
jgi:tripartite-type tricarboxylate transporter receptor subunit TctC